MAKTENPGTIKVPKRIKRLTKKVDRQVAKLITALEIQKTIVTESDEDFARLKAALASWKKAQVALGVLKIKN